MNTKLFLTTALLTAWSCLTAHAVPVVVTSRAAQAGNDSLLWTDLGSPGSSVASGTTALSANGLGVTVSNSNSSSFELRVQIPTAFSSWSGNFTPGDPVLWNSPSSGENGPTTLSFAAPVLGVGFNIMADFYGAFTGQVEAFDALNNSLGIFAYSGTSNGDSDGSAVYFGLQDTSASISRIVITGLTASSVPNDFAINQLSLNTLATAAPELDGATATLPLTMMLMGWLSLKRRKTT
ncbi:MAG: hypothetical protein J0I12_34345 [Candidatus Eremiobacteraeota bacterium]|nr:hypothetical protein [Candidatus Eremiobacteraeota bacterium]